MNLNGNSPYTKERLASGNRGGFFAEGDPVLRIMNSRYALGLNALAKLERNEDVRKLKAGEDREKLERTADQSKPVEQLPKEPIVLVPAPTPEAGGKVYSIEDIKALRSRIDTLSESRTIQMPVETAPDTNNEELRRVA